MSGAGNAGGFGTAVINGLPVIGSVASLNKYAVMLNSWESVTQELYDSAPYAAAGQAQLTFFATGQGQGTGVISNTAKGFEDTNLLGQGGQMPSGQAYVVSSIEVEFQPGVSNSSPPTNTADLPAVGPVAAATATAINDTYIFYTSGFLQFNIGSKPYMTNGPLMRFPPSRSFDVSGAMSNATTAASALYTAALFGVARGPVYSLQPNNILLAPTVNFNVTLNWSTLEAITRQARVFVRFGGQLFRAAQ